MNLYTGALLKQPPLSKMNAKVQTVINHPHFMSGFQTYLFPNCCGIKVLGDFEAYPSVFYPKYPDNVAFKPAITNKVVISAAVWRIKEMIDRQLSVKKAYLLVALNGQEMKTNIHCILMDYFGFQRLEDDFLNLQIFDSSFWADKRSRIAIFGLCTTRFYSRNITTYKA